MFNGNTEEAFNFYKSVFGGEFAAIVRFKRFTQRSEQQMDRSRSRQNNAHRFAYR